MSTHKTINLYYALLALSAPCCGQLAASLARGTGEPSASRVVAPRPKLRRSFTAFGRAESPFGAMLNVLTVTPPEAEGMQGVGSMEV